MLTQFNTETIWQALRDVKDPEVPVVDIVELGVVREVIASGTSFEILITPTYTGCPAMKTIEQDIQSRLGELGLSDVKIKTILKPVWTTEWMSEEAKLKLKNYGIAPPEKLSIEDLLPFLNPNKKPISCPQCDGSDTVLKSQFGSTACKALHFCNHCQEPFDYFKCI